MAHLCLALHSARRLFCVAVGLLGRLLRPYARLAAALGLLPLVPAGSHFKSGAD